MRRKKRDVLVQAEKRSFKMNPKTHESQRHGTRIRVVVPLRVTTLDPKAEFSERTKTLVVNLEGCGLTLSRPLERGTAVTLDELPSGRSATARVANCIPVGRTADRWLVGMALDNPDNVWGIEATPRDWNASKLPGSRESRDVSKT